MNDRLRNVLDFAAAGLCLIPMHSMATLATWQPSWEGHERPKMKQSIYRWRQYRTRQPSANEYEFWFGDNVKKGAAILTGLPSHGLEVLDFDRDAETIFPKWYQSVEDIACRLPQVETPSGGRHVYYRCSIIGPMHHLAKTDEGKVRIETRGEGSICMSTLSDDGSHNIDMPYVQVGGPPLPLIPTITPDERRILWAAAARFDANNQIWKKILDRQAAQRRREFESRYRTDDESTRLDRAKKYVAKIPPAISGAGGHNATYRVACVLVCQFGLCEGDALEIMHEWNQTCDPPWSDKELEHKVRSARQNGGVQ